MEIKDIPLIGNYLPSNKTINTNKYELTNIDDNYYMKFKYNYSEDCFSNKLYIDDKVAYVTTYYDNRFEKICKGTIIGFTECFIKIKPDEQYINTYQEKEYILRKYNRVIKL